MAKVKISEFDVNPDNNTDINNINIAEGCAPSGINNAIRQLMSDLKEFQTGAGGDSITAVGLFSDTVGEKTSAAGVTVDGVLLKDSGITASGTNVLSGTTIPSSKTLVVTTDIGTSVQAYDADTTKNDVANTFTANQIISVTDNTNAALRITQLGTGNALLVEDSANPDASPFVIDSTGAIIKGSTSLYASLGATPQVQINGTAVGDSTFAVNSWRNSANSGGLIALNHSKSGTIGTFSSLASGDSIGSVVFSGDDGTAFIQAASISAAVDGTPGTNDMPGRLVFSTTADGASSPTERMRIDSNGAVGIGTASLTGFNLRLGKNITGATTAYGIYVGGNIQSDVNANAYGVRSQLSTQATAFTLTSYAGFLSSQGTIGATSAITNQYGFIADSNLTGATNNYGFYSNIASGTGRWNFYANGTADNYFAGNVGIGTTAPTAKLTVLTTSTFDPNSAIASAGINIAQSGGTAGIGNYSTGLSFSKINSGRPYGAIAGVQTTSDDDQGGLAFFTHAGPSSSDVLVEQMRLDAAGNVGIGINDPQSVRLNVVTSANAVARFFTSSTAGNSDVYINNANNIGKDWLISRRANGECWSYTSGADPLVFLTNTAERMRIDSSGNVGMGISSAQARLQVYSLDSSAKLLVNGDDNNGNSAGLVVTYGNAAPSFYRVKAYMNTYNGLIDLRNSSNTDTVRIHSAGDSYFNGGNLLVGTTSATGSRADFFYDPGSSITPVISTRHQSSTGSSYATHLSFLNNSGTQVGYISANGSATFYGTSSDYRLKENIAPITGALAKVQELKPVTYKWKADGSNGEGFIAHELQEVLPECVVGEKDAVDAEGNPQYQGIDTSFLVATLTAAIQEQQAIINDLKARIETLESK
jgi:hypothetical protein